MVAKPNQRRGDAEGAASGLAAAGSSVVSPADARRQAVLSAHAARMQTQKADYPPEGGFMKSEGLNKLGAGAMQPENRGWDWCRKGRATLEMPTRPNKGSNFDMMPGGSIPRSNSSPALGVSLLGGKNGQNPEAFHGAARSFGVEIVDCRMRGGPLARNGWAGTCPVH
mmetsp:Transcript_39513/g.113261  ORF Transcript_39513/g.113261 Transcript_39513/m.113261 type:complete len:168 (-) Transcript_39513:186-689(-)